ncbi:MAG: hypothetical protein GX318_04850 [Clostridia bacterium]|nr:hypothetical protein [Clostridia bacterium]
MNLNGVTEYWRNIALVKEIEETDKCIIWLIDNEEMTILKSLDSVMEHLALFFGADLSENQSRFGRGLPIVPIYKDLIFLSLDGGESRVHLVKRHCAMYRDLKDRKGWSEILLADDRRIVVRHEASQIKELFQFVKDIENAMPRIYLVGRSRGFYFKETADCKFLLHEFYIKRCGLEQ